MASGQWDSVGLWLCMVPTLRTFHKRRSPDAAQGQGFGQIFDHIHEYSGGGGTKDELSQTFAPRALHLAVKDAWRQQTST